MDHSHNNLKKSTERKCEPKTFGLYAYLLMAVLTTFHMISTGIVEAYGRGSFLGFSGSMLLRLLPVYMYFFFLLAGLFLIIRRSEKKVINFAAAIVNAFKRLGLFNGILLALLVGFYGYLYLFFPPFSVLGHNWQTFILGHLILLGGLLLTGMGKASSLEALIGSISVFGLALWFCYWIPAVQTYPLALGWSETTWFYDASLFFSKSIYGLKEPLSSLHPSRYMMQSAAFLIPGLGLWGHRLWEVLLWICLTLGGGIALLKRIKPANSWYGLGIVAWFVLFTFQGPVYFHLMLVIIIVLLGFDKNNLGRSFFFMVVASLWAGISRVNWFPVAGMLAATLYILEKPQKEQTFWQYWRWPVIASISSLPVAFGASVFYAYLSRRPLEDFVSSFRSPLLFYRLFTNEAFGMGILIMVLIASLPAIVLILWRFITIKQTWRTLRLVGLLTILLALLISGLIVSTKIGGGNNLHNLDAFLVFLAIILIYILFNRFIADDPTRWTRVTPPLLLLILAALIPLLFTVDNMRPFLPEDSSIAWQDIAAIQEIIDQRLQKDDEVLFIQDRHLLTFGLIENVKLVPEYEKVFLMEMAMSENQPYLGKFYDDIKSHRFALIVVEPLYLKMKPQTEAFSEENNAWAKYVSRPIDQYFQVIYESEVSELSVLIPKPLE